MKKRSGEAGENKQRPGRRPGERQGFALLLHLLRKEVLLRHATNGGGEVGGKLGELGVALVGAIAIDGEVDPFRFGSETALERRRQRRALAPGKVVSLAIPEQRAIGDRD